VRLEPPPAWDQGWALQRAALAVGYLAHNYPECGGLEALDSYQEAVHGAAIAEDAEAYEEALRAYMRAGKREALAAAARERSGAA
jgi:hypothetical protein